MKKYLIASVVALTVALVASSANAAFTRNLTVGSTGADVAELQAWLISKGYAIPSISSGAAAPGYFGAQTKTAVMAYQAANGIPNTGFFGPLTRASVEAGGGVVTGGTGACPAGFSCTPTATTPSCPVGFVCTPLGGGTPIQGSNGLQGGAGDITVTERTSGTSDEVLEGEEDVEVLGFEVEAIDSDIALNSVRVEFKHTGSGSKRLNRYVDEVSIVYDGKVVGSADASDFSESSNVYSRNIALSKAVVENDETGRFYVVVSAVNNIDSDDIGETWVVGVGQIRFEDATGVVLTDTTGDGVTGNDDGPISESFTFEDLSSSGDIRLRVTEDDNAVNRARPVQVDDDSDTNDVNILSFALDAEGSDITLNSMTFAIVSTGAGVTEIANDFRLMVGDDEVGTVTIDRDNDGGSDGFASSTDTTVWVVVSDIDDDDIVIEADEEVTFMLVADINDVDGAFTSGDSIVASLNADDIDAEDENGDTLDTSDLTGSVSTEGVEFLSSGVAVEVTSTPDATYLVGGDATTDDRGQFVMEFEVTAIEDTAWVELTAASSTDAAGDNLGVAFNMENASTDAAVMTGTTSAVLARISGGTTSGNFVKIDAGQTATFRLTVSHDAASTGFYRVQMTEVGFNQDSATDADKAQTLAPEADYQSDSIEILN